jgi:putative phosphoribosyl transferase
MVFVRQTLFTDRAQAGRRLGARLSECALVDPVVLGLPRGGVPVAVEVARALNAPLDVIVVRKLGVPFQPELAMGAVGEDGAVVVNEDVLRELGLGPSVLAGVRQREEAEVAARARRFRGGRPRVNLTGRTAVLVDDGIATGATMRAACQVARAHGARQVLVAVPVAADAALGLVRHEADQVVCLQTPSLLFGVGGAYADFSQVTDAEVLRMLPTDQDVAIPLPPAPDTAPATDTAADTETALGAAPDTLPGRLRLPPGARGVVVFAHGSGSGRHSPRNRYVADVLHRVGLGTLLLDLLSPREELDRGHVFDVDLLAGRLLAAARWLGEVPGAAGLPIGYFGASTGAAAALVAAGDRRVPVAAVVSRGGRPDLAGERLALVRAPTLFIVGGRDDVVLELNRRAAHQLRCPHRIEVIPGATHLFEETGALARVAELARDWFGEHCTPPGAGAAG